MQQYNCSTKFPLINNSIALINKVIIKITIE